MCFPIRRHFVVRAWIWNNVRINCIYYLFLCKNQMWVFSYYGCIISSTFDAQGPFLFWTEPCFTSLSPVFRKPFMSNRKLTCERQPRLPLLATTACDSIKDCIPCIRQGLANSPEVLCVESPIFAVSTTTAIECAGLADPQVLVGDICKCCWLRAVQDDQCSWRRCQLGSLVKCLGDRVLNPILKPCLSCMCIMMYNMNTFI